MSSMIPFLTWAGGKRWLTQNHKDLFPGKFARYIEPFLGSGAVFFNLLPDFAILADLNSSLVNTYQQIKYNYKDVEEKLRSHHSMHSKSYYYKIRSMELTDPVDRAAQFIYLNRTCWNGLYRVNRKGIFNVPIGTKKNVILDTDNFRNVSEKLKHADLVCADFGDVGQLADDGDFIYFDPPYTVQHNNNNFIKYNKKLFSWDDQIKLFHSAREAKNRGAMVAISNAFHESIVNLYKEDFHIHELSRFSSISGRGAGRRQTEEVLITSY